MQVYCWSLSFKEGINFYFLYLGIIQLKILGLPVLLTIEINERPLHFFKLNNPFFLCVYVYSRLFYAVIGRLSQQRSAKAVQGHNVISVTHKSK